MSAVSTHVVESAVIAAPAEAVWAALSDLRFSWWGLVASAAPGEGGSSSLVGSLFDISFKDGVQWTIQLVELSNLHKSLTFEVISCEPSSPFTSVIHTLSVKRVTVNNTSYVEWTTDFSSDANNQVVLDSSYKRREAFADLARSF